MIKIQDIEPEQLKILKELEESLRKSNFISKYYEFKQVKEINNFEGGVKIENGNIISLSLAKLSVSEHYRLPNSILKLSHLKELRLKSMGLAGLPRFLSGFGSLEVLDLSGNKIYKPREDFKYLDDFTFEAQQFKNLNQVMFIKSLKKLDLSSNKLEELPYAISNLKNLEELNLGLNQMKDFGALSRLNLSLKRLDLQANDLTSIPNFIFNLKNLESLNLYENMISEIPKDISNLSNLQELNLGGNGLNKIPFYVGKLKNLRVLNLWKNNLSDLPDFLGNLNNLESLIISLNQFKRLPTFLWHWINIKSLSLANNPWQDDWKGILNMSVPAILDMARQRDPISIIIYNSDIDKIDMKDSMNKLIEDLRSKEEIHNIDTSIENNIQENQLLLFIATQNSIIDEKCIKDLKLWISSNKALIPLKSMDILWEDLNNINLGVGFNLSNKLGFEFNIDDIEKLSDMVYKHILKYKHEINLFKPIKMSILEPWGDVKKISKEYLDTKEFNRKFNENIDFYRKLYNDYKEGLLSPSKYLLKYIESINSLAT
ncbi:MAG: leucine-rich repeat domain-containing protein [Promethearchaeota archaeon]